MRCAALPNNGCNTASAQATPAAYAWLHACCDRERAQALPRPLCRTCMRSRCCNVWTAMQEAVVLTNMAERKMNEERCRSRCSCYDCFQCRVWARHAISHPALARRAWQPPTAVAAPVPRCTHAHRCKLLCASAGSRGTRGRGAICAADGALPVPPLCISCNTFTILSILATMPSLPWASAARSLGAHTAALDPAIAPLTRFSRMQEAKAILDAACATREVRCPGMD